MHPYRLIHLKPGQSPCLQVPLFRIRPQPFRASARLEPVPVIMAEKSIQENSSRTSDIEKATSLHDPQKSRLDQFPDPDEGLSEEERAKIVR